MQVTNFRIETDDDFTVDFKHQAQHPVGGWMLRPHIQDHVLVFCALGKGSLEDRRAYALNHQRYPSTG